MRLPLALLLLMSLLVSSLHADTLRAATFNIRVKTDMDLPAGNGWDTRRKQVRELIRFHNFELIGFQEVLRTQLDDLLADPSYGHAGAGRDDGANAGEFSPIFFLKERFTLLDSGTFWLSETPEKVSYGWDAQKYHRICTWVRLQDKHSGKVLRVWNTHFYHEAVEARRNSAKLLLARVTEAAKEGGPVILMGDLNSTPDSEPYRILVSGLKDTRQLSQLPPYGPVGTFNGFKYEVPAVDRIDHIFVGEGVSVLRHGTLSDAVDLHYPSDHFPVVTELRY